MSTQRSYYSVMPSAVGPLTLRWSGDALVGAYFDDARELAGREAWVRDDACLLPVRAQLEEYFRGERETFDLPLAFEGTAFQTSVWRALVEIPFGETTSYGEIARRIGKSSRSSSRAVGAANGQNPIVVIVPCHRVIGADGSLTGFGGGLPRKHWLLAHEARSGRAAEGRQMELGPAGSRLPCASPRGSRAMTRLPTVVLRSALLRVPPSARDAWLDALLGLHELPDDGPGLPRGCVPYFPSPVDALLRMVDEARVGHRDVFVDVGAGIGRAAAFVHLLTGADVVGIEVQPALVRAARDLATRLSLPRVVFVEGDAAEVIGSMTTGSVFFLYCPFSGERLAKLMAALERIARARTIRLGCLDVPLPPCPWLTLEPRRSSDLAVYRSR